MKRSRWPNYMRTVSAALLLLLLGICGYAGARQPEVSAVSVPLSREASGWDMNGSLTIEATREKLIARRQEELALLDSVLVSEFSAEESRKTAQEQRILIAERMEAEAQTEASLAYMGVGGAAVVCGAEIVTVFLPFDQATDEMARVRILDAAASAAGVSPESVKIILVKK